MLRELYELELLREDWDMLLMESEELLYSHGADAYKGISSDFKRWAKEESNPVCWVEGAGHNANSDNPTEVNLLIEAFLEQQHLI